MKFVFLTLVCCLSLVVFAQKKRTEWYVNAGSGVFFYSGDGAVSNQTVYSGRYHSNQTSPYGKKPGICGTVGLSLRREVRAGWLWGLGAELQSFSNSSDIVRWFSASPVSPFPSTEGPATGSSKHYINFVALHSFVGKRYAIGKSTLDITAGPEGAIVLGAKKKQHYVADYTTSTGEFHQEVKLDQASTHELRLSLQARLQVKKWGVTAGYTRGLTDSSPTWEASFTSYARVYSNFVRLNLSYRLR